MDYYSNAKRVIQYAYDKYVSREWDSPSIERAIRELYDTGSGGGVAHANRRAQQRVRQEIREFLEPREPKEPTYGGACG
jgi:hypothetical protein